MAQVGRISGPLLEENLVRNGIDLAFRNDLDTTQLLYLDVNTGRIAVNSDAPAVELDVIDLEIRTVNLIADTAPIANYTFSSNNINVSTGNIFLNANEAIVLSNLETEQYYVTDNTISTKDSNTNIELRPNGTGILDIYNDLRIYGNLDTPGNITLEGTITFGDTLVQDTVTFEADVNSDIIPDITDTYDLGSVAKRWKTLNTSLLNGQLVTSGTVNVSDIFLESQPGNIIYVAENGLDTNVGGHQTGPLATIQEAISRCDASTSGPIMIFLFPGIYEETCPLVVPDNVTITGADIRNVIVKPTVATQDQDIFHLGDSSTVSNLTVKDFYYDDINNTGYAFRFAPGAVISTRSPYVQNVSVITHGTNIGESDPRGFNSGDAGKGAYINGAEMNPASFDASMLFHSCTFITPGVDAITMTNGVRVEWLNSFTYFADRGLYALAGLTGRTSQDGSTVNYGAELRSIGSANVYGNFGAVADGADTLMYLIQHNMAYIGSGASADNDPSLAILANKVVELNSGQVHYVTTDHTGAFRVGDNFFIDFESGSTTIDLNTLTANSLTGIVINNGSNTTTVDGGFIETGNFRIDNNSIQSLSDDINVAGATGIINLNNNSTVTGNLDVTGNFTFDGALSFAGDAPGDALTFNVELEQDFNPNQTMAFKLGSPSKKWLIAHLNRLEVGDFSVYDNRISTNVSNADIELRANGSGRVYIPDNTAIENNLSVAGISSFADINITGLLDLNGNLNITGNRTISNDLTVTQNISIGAAAQFEEILIDDNFITTTTSNTDLELRASGTGEILTDRELVLLQDFSFTNSAVSNNLTAALNLSADNANISNIEINDNYIEATVLDADLELRSAQDVSVPSNSVQVNNNLTAIGATDLQATIVTGLIDHTGNRTQTGDYDIAGELAVDNVYIEDNFITTTSGNLTLLSTQNVVVPLDNVSITNNLTVNGITDLQALSITGALLHTGDVTQTGNYDLAGELTVDGVYVEDNFITSTGASVDLELRADGLGNILIPANNVQINNNLTVSGTTNLQSTNITGPLTRLGNATQTGNLTQTGFLTVDGSVTITSATQFEDVRIEGNVVQTTASNSDLDLRASGNGTVIVRSSTRVFQDLFAASITSGNIIVNQDLELNEIIIPPSIIEIDDNFISTRVSNADLELRANGLGTVFVPNNSVAITNNLTVDQTTDVQDLSVIGTVTHTESRTQTGNYALTGNLLASGTVTVSAAAVLDDLAISGNLLSSTAGDLVLGASGTGNVVFSDLVAGQDISSATLTTGSIIIDGTFALEELESSTDIQIFDNVITTTNSNSNLELRANSTGAVTLQDLKFNGNRVFTETEDIVFSPANNLIIAATGALEIPTGTSEQRIAAEDIFLDFGIASSLFVDIVDGGDALTVFNSQSTVYNAGGAQISSTGNIGDLRFNTEDSVFEGFSNAVISFGGVYSDNRLTNVLAHPTNNSIIFSVNGIQLANVNSDNITLHGLQVEDILVNNNVITTNTSNADLELRRAGAGEIVLDNVSIIDNRIKNNSASLVISNTSNGYAKISSTFGAVFPAGTVAERPVADPEVGDTRFNTDDDVLEVWDGSTYVAAAGTSATISESEFNDLIFEYTLIFG